MKKECAFTDDKVPNEEDVKQACKKIKATRAQPDTGPGGASIEPPPSSLRPVKIQQTLWDTRDRDTRVVSDQGQGIVEIPYINSLENTGTASTVLLTNRG